jgi:hypothetical protein
MADHSMTLACLQLNNLGQSDPLVRRIWKFSQVDPDNVNTAVNDFDWDSILDIGIPNEVSQRFTGALLSILVSHIPHYDKVCKPIDMPWFNSGIRRAINKRTKCYRKMVKEKSQLNVRAFKDASINVRDLVTNAKNTFQNKLCNSLNEKSTGSKNYWHIIKKLLGKKFSSGIPTLTCDDSVLDSDKLKGEQFLKNFSSKFHHNHNELIIPNFPTRTDAMIDNILISSANVRKLLQNLDPGKQGGEDGISNRMLKIIACSLALPLSKMFNLFLRTGSFPTNWKLGIVVPIFKNKGSKSDPVNYRPVTLLNSLSKVFERLVFDAILLHLQQNDLIFERQSGFMPGHDTQKQLLHIVHMLLKNNESKMVTRGVFLDIAGAFDAVPHYLLIRKLHAYGIKLP